MMFKIMSIPNADKFFSVVEHSKGNVFLRLPDNSQCDLKRDRTGCVSPSPIPRTSRSSSGS